ncbi:TetR/AcrR family transcriptional regulator [Conexibacter woesei]|uniref:Transcriptional regulator, TetR family n=1 Tax=Conexibacter woesei (strain DSM 14684 / CCUG 47730 / CIP 108061 / JCM 11494 / NBRC 100937 / ID131577) TaxID=469383 RepID=D3F8Z0_CONWI|nr:TetR/AcrR family transcriptional regulator [Conexibacter woesei]ADB52985.1 transcriptional regulator, TetR family [Conexibacter woesei DSM 14684]
METPVAIEGARERLVCGMNAAVAEKGYAPTTIADVVRHARVSKRTFYEHFGDKRACFLAAYDTASAHVLGAMRAASEAAAGAPWSERVERVVVAYLEAMAAKPELTQTFLIEILGAGPLALAHRRETMERFADQLVALCADLRRAEPQLRPVSRSLATAVVGGINELVLGAVEQGRASELAQLRRPAAELIRSVLTGPEP